MSASQSWPDLAGRLVDGGHILPVRVYYEDTDFSGVVYHASYIRFLERGRTDYLRLSGIGHDALAKGAHGEPLAFAVRRLTADYLKPARIDDLVEVETRTEAITGTRIQLAQAIRRDDTLLVRAEITVVMIGPDGGLRRIPKAVAARLATPRP